MLEIVTSGPHKEEYYTKAIDPLFEDYDKIIKKFSGHKIIPKKTEEEVAKELLDLNNL